MIAFQCVRTIADVKDYGFFGRPQFDMGNVGLIGWLTALVSDTTMALVEHGALLGLRQLDMGNSG